MSAAKKEPAKAASAATPPRQIPVSRYDVTMNLARADAALELLRLADDHCAGEQLGWMHNICLDTVADAIDRARAAYTTAVSDPTEAARSIDWYQQWHELQGTFGQTVDALEMQTRLVGRAQAQAQARAIRQRLAAVRDDADPALVALRDELLTLLTALPEVPDDA